MPLTHVCLWESKIGYRRITVEEANEREPREVPAKKSPFVCELCAQNVGFSKARADTGTRYFFTAVQNKIRNVKIGKVSFLDPELNSLFHLTVI